MSNLSQSPSPYNLDCTEPRPVYRPVRCANGMVRWQAPLSGLTLTSQSVLDLERDTRGWYYNPAAVYRYYMEAAQ